VAGVGSSRASSTICDRSDRWLPRSVHLLLLLLRLFFLPSGEDFRSGPVYLWGHLWLNGWRCTYMYMRTYNIMRTQETEAW
jgi:hypothetical protein